MASAGKWGRNPGTQDFLRLSLSQEASSQCKYIGIIVFPAISGGSFIIAQGRADARNLVGRHGRSDTRAIDQYAPRGGAGSDEVGHQNGDVGIVGRLRVLHAHIADGQAERFDEGLESFLEKEAAVVRAKGQSLGSSSHWIMNGAISLLFPIIAQRSGAAPFVFFSAMMILQFFVVWFFYPETKGATLEELQHKLGIA